MVTNIVDRYISILKDEFKDYSKLILGKNFNTEIFNIYLENYIESRYYNFIEETNIRTFRDRMINEIETTKSNLFEKGIYKENILNSQCEILKNLLVFDNVSTVQNEDVSINKLQETDKEILHRIEKIYKKTDLKNNEKNIFLDKHIFYDNLKRTLKEKYESKIFNVKYIKLDKDIYISKLEFNIRFSKIYSKSFIETAFTTGTTNEDKLQVEYSIVSKDILNDILDHNFKKKYILNLADSLLSKQKKMKSILNILNSSALQEKASLLITYNNFIRNKDNIYNFIKLGYKFSVYLDESFEPDLANLERLNMFEYSIISNELSNYNEIIKNKKEIKNLIEK